MIKKYTVIPEDAVIIKNRAYYSSSKYNGFFYSELGENYGHHIGIIPGEIVNGERLYASLQCVDERYVCMLPFTANEIAVYDTIKEMFFKVSLPKDIKEMPIKFMASAEIDNIVIAFGLFNNSVYEIDIYKKKCLKVSSWEDKKDSIEVFDDRDSFFRYQTQIYDGNIYVPFCNANAVLIYSYNDNRCNIVNFDDKENGYSGVRNKGNSFYFSPRKVGQRGMKWDINSGCIEYMDDYDKYIIGLCIENNKAVYCSSDQFSFIRNDNLVFDISNRVIRYFKSTNESSWTTEIIKSEKTKIDVGMLADGGGMFEAEWFSLEDYLNSIVGDEEER